MFRSRLTYCLHIVLISADSQDCEQGWQHYEGSCYLFNNTLDKWTSHQISCRLFNGTLAVIETPEENEFLKNMARSNQAVVTYLGGFDVFTEGRWSWSHPSGRIDNDSFTDFGKDQPDGGEDEDCLALAKDLDYQWADVKCKGKGNSICELNLTAGLWIYRLSN
ncbi:hypothetical protein BsWGS_28313 [Bradybaena similaris]